MDQKHRDIIEEYRSLLSRNLIITEEFYKTLVTYGVFTEGLIKDLKKAPRSQLTTQLLDLLLTRTNSGFGKFCDVLEATGHRFLSDCLREAENVQSAVELDIEDIVNKLPFLSKSLKNDQQRAAMQRYFKDKIHSEVVKQTWRGDMATKERLMVTRQQQIEQMWQHEEESKIKDKNMQELQQDYMKLQERGDDLRREIKSLHKHIEDMTKKHQEQLTTQVKFNMANDRHLNRLNERAEDAGSYLATIQTEVKAILAEDYYERQARTEYENLEENFKKLMIQYRNLCSTLDKFRNEREYLSNQLAGLSVSDEQSLKPHFQQYIIKIEETKTALDKRIEELRKVNEEQLRQIKELDWVQQKVDEEKKMRNAQADEASTQLQREIESATAKLKERDEKIELLEKDLDKLARRVQQMEKELAESQANAKKARELANQMIPKAAARTPPKTPQRSEQSPISNHYKKPTMTRTTGVFIMDKNSESLSSLDAIKGQGLGVSDSSSSLPAGVKRLDQDGGLKAAMKNASTLNASVRSSSTKQTITRSSRRY